MYKLFRKKRKYNKRKLVERIRTNYKANKDKYNFEYDKNKAKKYLQVGKNITIKFTQFTIFSKKIK